MNNLHNGGLTGTIPSNLKNMDYIINGFSIKETIKEVLDRNLYEFMEEEMINLIADEIKEAFAVKMRMKQG